MFNECQIEYQINKYSQSFQTFELSALKRQDLVRIGTLVTILAFIMLPAVSAQTTLIANETLEDEFIWGREDQFYERGFYQITLDSGHWTIVVQSFFDLDVNITVASNSDMTNIIEVSGTGWGSFPEVDFDLAAETTVYIVVHENSVYGDSSGFYNIGVYDDVHLATLETTTFSTNFSTNFNTDFPFDFLNSFTFILVLFIGLGGFALILCVVCVLRKSKTQIESLQVIRAPQAAIPQEYKSRTEVDDGLRMVRIPVECPNCKAPLSSETIDWVGPLEAKCNYCGSTVRAKFEKI